MGLLKVQQQHVSVVDERPHHDSICKMASGWKTFFRRADRTHVLEAKIASGGEPYGPDDMDYRAKKGEWICRNPQNGYCWVMDEEGMDAFYIPKDRDDKQWEALQEKLEPLKAEMKKKKKQKQKQKQSAR